MKKKDRKQEQECAGEVEGFRGFFEKRELLVIVDLMARRYNKLPSEILKEQTVHDFNFNLAVLFGALEEEKQARIEAEQRAKSGKKQPSGNGRQPMPTAKPFKFADAGFKHQATSADRVQKPGAPQVSSTKFRNPKKPFIRMAIPPTPSTRNRDRNK